MGSLFFVIVVLVTSLAFSTSSDNTYCVDIDQYQLNKRLVGNTLAILPVMGPFRCMRDCLVRASCKSVNYHEHKGCYLNYEDKGNGILMTDEGYVYMDKTNFPNEMVNPCNDTTCLNNEKCVVTEGHYIKTECLKAECSDPPVVQSCVISENTTRMIGVTVQYSCPAGNSTLSDNKMKYECSVDAEWKLVDISCPVYMNYIAKVFPKICYKHVMIKTDYNQADEFCKLNNADIIFYNGHSHLLIIDSKEKKDAVVSEAQGTDCVWLNGKYQNDTGTWRNWKGEITMDVYNAVIISSKSGCMAMRFGDIYPLPCNNSCSFLCEIGLP